MDRVQGSFPIEVAPGRGQEVRRRGRGGAAPGSQTGPQIRLYTVARDIGRGRLVHIGYIFAGEQFLHRGYPGPLSIAMAHRARVQTAEKPDWPKATSRYRRAVGKTLDIGTFIDDLAARAAG